jgi:valyl-tRNA synthetase
VTTELPGNEHYGLLYGNDSLIADNSALIEKLARLKGISHVDQPKGLRLPASGREAWLDVSAKTLDEHQTNLETRLAETHAEIARLEGRLANKDYLAKAPVKLVEDTRQQLDAKKTLATALGVELKVLR